MIPTKSQPLFIITGASCVGKSTICEQLFRNETTYIVMESDLLWQDIFNTPEDDYRAYRKLWMRVCANISQIGLPVVLCGCVVPKQFEALSERELFTKVHYLAVICDDVTLEQRMRVNRGISDNNWISSSLDFNRWLKENADKMVPNITLLDTTDISSLDAAEIADRWIADKMNPEQLDT